MSLTLQLRCRCAAALAHEFKTPLAGLNGGIELLQDHGDTMSGQERARFLANMAEDTQRLSRLISRLLDLAKADMQRPGNAACDLREVVVRLADGLGGPDFRVVFDESEVAATVAMHGAALETVLMILFDNAKAAGASAVSLEARRTSASLELTVTDNGKGIARSDRPRVFEPFFTSKRAQGGTGLGLPIARALVRGHGGQLELVDSPRGAKFRVALSFSSGSK